MTDLTVVLRVPIISTAHLPDNESVNGAGIFAASYEGGWFVYMGDELEEDSPKWYREVQRWAKPLGFHWVRFDHDGDVMDCLPEYNW